MTKLTTEAVETIFKHVLFKDDEAPNESPPEDAVKVEGLVNQYAFHPSRLTAAKSDIDGLLSELPAQFHRGKGGGWSFLNACMNNDGDQWGEHRDIERLICLGIGVGSASWLMKDMAEVMPGGVPYLEVHPA